MNRKQRRADKSKQKSPPAPPPVQDPLWSTFNEGLTHQGAGRFADAERIYKSILEINPRHAHTLHMIGLMAYDLKRYDVSEEFIRKAIAEQNDVALFYSSLGNALKLQKKYEEAAAQYKKALNLKPDYVDVLSNLGAILLNFNKKNEASEVFEKALAINPQHFNSLNNMGIIAEDEKRYDQARSFFEQAIDAKSDFAEAYKNLGLLFKRQGHLEEAVINFEQAIKYKTDYVDALSDLANTLRDLQRYTEAKKYYEQVVALRPDAYALANIASVLKQQGKIRESIAYFERALALAPDSYEILNNMAIVHMDTGKYKKAADIYRQAIALKPDQGAPLSNLGTALKNMGQLDESIDYLKKAVSAATDSSFIYSNLLLTMVYSSAVSPEELASTARKYGDIVDPILRQRPFSNDRNSERKLRIGYVSADFCNHAVNYFFEPLLNFHDKSQVEIYAYSNTENEDGITERLKKKVDYWRIIKSVANDKVADIIEEDKIDILVDLSGHTGKNRLLIFAIKPAPVQITWLGYPATTGIKSMDYRITDIHAEPKGMTEHLNVETLYRLPEIFCCYQPHENSPAVIDHLPFDDNGFITFGCFNNFSKVTDEVLFAWATIMDRVPNSRLLLEITGVHEPEFYKDVVQRLGRLGLLTERVLLEPRRPENQFVLYNKIDIALDPFPCNGGTTSFDTLWMGVPFVTLEGHHFVSRMGVTILTNAGLSELIAKDTNEYIKITADLANDRERLKKMRHGLRQRIAASPLMDQQRFARNMEAAYRDIWRKWCETTK